MGDVQIAIMEGDLLDGVIEFAQSDAHDLSIAAFSRATRAQIDAKLCDDTVGANGGVVRLGEVGEGVIDAWTAFEMAGIEEAVSTKVGMESDTA